MKPRGRTSPENVIRVPVSSGGNEGRPVQNVAVLALWPRRRPRPWWHNAPVFVGHFAAGLAAKRVMPDVSLATWFVSVQLLDLIWPLCLLLGLEHVRIVPGITAFTPLDFYDYPITHSLVGAAAWAALFTGAWAIRRGRRTGALLVFLGVLSHWLLDVVAHRPDVPVLPHGPYLGLGLWNSVPATLIVETAMFAAGISLYARVRRPTVSFWILMAVLFVLYLAAAFGPPPPTVRVLAFSALAGWLFVAWAWWVDRDTC